MKEQPAKTTKKQPSWTKGRHKAIFWLLRPFFNMFFKLRYNYSTTNEEAKTPSPCLIMSNHLTTLDPFAMAMSFRRPLYYVTSDDLFTIPVISPIIRFLVAPIPKSKSKSDLNTIRFTLKVLEEGGTVAIFPEGNRSLSGGNWEIDISTAKFAKMVKVPLVLYKIQGGYGSDPRWGNDVRKGKMSGSVVKVLSVEEVAAMSVEELYQEICSCLISDDYLQDQAFHGKARAQFLERALYYCPECKSFNCLQSKKHHLLCKNCNFKVEYTPTLTFNAEDKPAPYPHVKEWFDDQRIALSKLSQAANEDQILFEDEGLEFRKIVNKRKRVALGKGNISATKYTLSVTLKKQALTLSYPELVGVTVVGKQKINFYLENGDTLQIKGSKRFNAVKYLHLFEENK
jgi:1-acyl-sn-glycerol-3-phosphate acyltransferase